MRGLTVLFAVVLAVLACTAYAAAQSIVIDPGHGGEDPGGTGTGLEEKDIVLDTSLRFRDLLVADTADASGGGSWTTNLTRDTDVFISLAARSAYANDIGADRFMSIHANAFGTASANGTETFSYSDTGTGAALRNLVQEEMISAWGLTNRGNKTANFSVLANTAMPAELHELAFVTNAGDAAKLGDPAARQDAAEAHLRALQRHYGITPFVPNSLVDPEYGTLVVSVRSAEGAIADARILLDGTSAGSTDSEGALQIDAVESGAHLVEATATGYIANELSVEVLPEELHSLVIELEAEGGAGGGGDGCSQDEDCSGGLAGGCSSAGQDSLPLSLMLLLVLTLLRRMRSSRSPQAQRVRR